MKKGRKSKNIKFVNNPFASFWMGGYECTDQLNAFGNRVDLLQTTGHFDLMAQDYQQLQPFGIKTVREGIRWSQVEKEPYQYDWTAVAKMMAHGKQCGIQQVWDICHFGFPDDLTPLHPHFTNRFAALCRAFVSFYRTVNPDGPLIVTPINEVSFLSWLGGDVGGTAPFAVRMGWDVKYHLMRAYIQGINAMREVDPGVRILTTEPLINIAPPLSATEQELHETAVHHNYQYQALDILSGRMCPELGGTPEHLDIVGLNYYYNNQWVLGYREFLPWANIPIDDRWRPLSSLLLEAHQRYQRPVILSETSHAGIDRPHWISFIAKQVSIVLRQGVPFWGVCLYPIIDRPDWDHPSYWHQSGLWDAAFTSDAHPERVLYAPYAEALLKAQALTTTARKKTTTVSRIAAP